LRISQGWVKCGQCGDIFDATQHLVQSPTEVEASIEVKLPVEAQNESPADVLANSLDIVPAENLGTSNLSEAQPDDGQSIQVEPEPIIESEIKLGLEPEASSGPLSLPPSVDAASREVVSLDSVSFLRGMGESDIWSRKSSRVILQLSVTLLSMGLAGQWVYQERDRLAVMSPSWNSGLHTFCDAVGCAISPPKQIESISIENATFNKLDNSHYRLSLTLRNQANLALALPSLELTLTDLQDQAIFRRVLSTSDLMVSSDRLAPASEWPVTVTFSMQPETETAGIVGYRLLAFYP
jgi:hypothetical protein